MIDELDPYRVFFRFSVRNGNCMVYPFDVSTGSELNNSSMTENGFRLDPAKSRYLKVNLKREIMTASADGLVEDVRFNGPAKEGAEYTDEGIYTITVSNEFTGQTTEKKLYVGSNEVMQASVRNDLTIAEINNLLAQGASIRKDGTIDLSAIETAKQESASNPQPEPESIQETEPQQEIPEAAGNFEAVQNREPENSAQNGGMNFMILLAAGAAVLRVILICADHSRRKKRTQVKTQQESGCDPE